MRFDGYSELSASIRAQRKNLSEITPRVGVAAAVPELWGARRTIIAAVNTPEDSRRDTSGILTRRDGLFWVLIYSDGGRIRETPIVVPRRD